jgi:hypothetical protein
VRERERERERGREERILYYFLVPNEKKNTISVITLSEELYYKDK